MLALAAEEEGGERPNPKHRSTVAPPSNSVTLQNGGREVGRKGEGRVEGRVERLQVAMERAGLVPQREEVHKKYTALLRRKKATRGRKVGGKRDGRRAVWERFRAHLGGSVSH